MYPCSSLQDLSSFALPGFADGSAATAAVLAAPAGAHSADVPLTARPRSGSAGLKSLLKFRHQKKPAAPLPATPPVLSKGVCYEDGCRATAASSPSGTPPQPQPPCD